VQKKQIKILIYINDSLGELDWIAPFINLSNGDDYEYLVYFNLPGKSFCQKKLIYTEYFGQGTQTSFLNEAFEIPGYLGTLDQYLNSILRRVSGKSFTLFQLFRTCADALRKLVSKLVSHNYKVPRYDILMRDYNLKDSFALAILTNNKKNIKTCIFPHSTAIQSNTKNTKKNLPKIVDAQLFLENTNLSNQFSDTYNSIFVACGSPQIEEFIKKEERLLDLGSKSILFITRNCDPRFFGITYDDAGKVFEESLLWAKGSNINVFVKHHPRDARLDFWRNIQSKFDNVTEVTKSLNSFTNPIAFAFCLYTSACLLFTARGVPVFDVSPYKGDVSKLPFHYLNGLGEITHELIEYGMCGRIVRLVDFFDGMNDAYLGEVASNQLDALLTHFPLNSYSIIDVALKKIAYNDVMSGSNK
jgi:hypothetical protein